MHEVHVELLGAVYITHITNSVVINGRGVEMPKHALAGSFTADQDAFDCQAEPLLA